MAQKTFKIGKQKIPRVWVYAGGAAVLGIAIFARFRDGGFGGDQGPPPQMFDEFGNPIPGGTPGEAAPFTDSNLELSPDNEFADNGEWTRFATSHLQSLGANGTVVVSALGKFLQRKPLSRLEADLVSQAVAVAGFPPDGRPWTIIEGGDDTPPAETEPDAPTNLRTDWVRQTSVKLVWAGTADSWRVERVGGGTATRSGRSHVSGGLKPDTEYTFRVRGRSPGGTLGPPASITVRTAPASSTPAPKGRPPAVRNVRAGSSGRGVLVEWDGARSGHYRQIRWETATSRGRWVRAQNAGGGGLQVPRTGRTYRIAVQQVRKSDGRGSKSARSNRVRT